jgi:hypothetical protein
MNQGRTLRKVGLRDIAISLGDLAEISLIGCPPVSFLRICSQNALGPMGYPNCVKSLQGLIDVMAPLLS